MNGLECPPGALCQARVWAVPGADGVLSEEARDQPWVPARIRPPREGGHRHPADRGVSELEPTTDPGALLGALLHLLLLRTLLRPAPPHWRVGGSAAPVLFLTVAPLARCSVELQNNPSVCTEARSGVSTI